MGAIIIFTSKIERIYWSLQFDDFSIEMLTLFHE